MKLAIKFHPDGSSHRDITVRLGAFQWRCDSYYFALDRGLDAESGESREDDVGARRVLSRLLRQWLEHATDLDDGGTVFLPFAYSDQSTGCVRLTRTGGCVNATLGWSSREGWSTDPSDISDYVRSVADFTAIDADPVDFALEEFCQAVTASAEALGNAS